MSNSLKEKIKVINANIISWVKQHKVVSLLIILFTVLFVFKFFICVSIQAYNSFKYGSYELIGEYPSGIIYHALKVDNNSIIFFIKKNNCVFEIAQFNVNTNTFSKYKTKISTNNKTFCNSDFIKPIDIFNDKIYMFYNQNGHINSLAYFDYIKDDFKKVQDLKPDAYFNPIKITLNGNEYIFLKVLAEDPHKKNTKIQNKFHQVLLYSPLKDKFLTIDFSVSVSGVPIRQLNDGKILIFSMGAKKTNSIIRIIDLKNKTVKSNNIKKIKSNPPILISPDNNKFIIIDKLIPNMQLTTYDISSSESVKEISSLYIEHIGIFNKYYKFAPENHVVLKPDLILFVGGFNSLGLYGGSTNTTYMYNYSSNTIKKITNFPLKIANTADFLRLNDSSFIVYSIGGKIYKFDLKGGN